MSRPRLNALEHKDAERALAAAGASCWISATALGPRVTQVKQSTFSQNNLYWMGFSPSSTIKELTFEVTFTKGSPLAGQLQTFRFAGGYGGGTVTPFGVPLWGGDPILGPALMTVKTDTGEVCEYKFEVVA